MPIVSLVSLSECTKCPWPLLGWQGSLDVLVGIAWVLRRPCWDGRSVFWPELLWLLTTAALLAQEQPEARKKSICIHCIWQMVVQYVFVFVRVIGNYLLSSDQRWILCIVLKIRQTVEFDRFCKFVDPTQCKYISPGTTLIHGPTVFSSSIFG